MADELDRPDVVAEVTAAFEAYERALVANDVEAMNRWFWDDARVLRYGIAECQYGAEQIAAWRAAATPVPATRLVGPVVVQAWSDDLASVDCEFRNGEEPGRGRQSQLWRRFADGWHVVRAHVSMIDD